MAKEIVQKKQRKIPYKYLVIFFMAFLLYANTIPHEYAWDDKIVIEKNPRVQKGISGIPDLFVKHSSKFQYDKYGYRPITLISFAIDYSISNGQASFSHFMNAFYYGILCVLILSFLSKLFKEYHFSFAFLIALLFMSHPLHVEVVANIKSRDEIFSFIFSIASFIYFIKFMEGKKWTDLIGSLAAYLLAFLSKENAITVLAIYPLLFFVKRIYPTKKQLVLSILSIVGLTSVSLLIYYLATKSTADAEISMGKGIYEENGILGNSFFHLSGFWNKLPNAVHVLGLYLKNFLIPYPLVFYYGYNVVPVTGWGNAAVVFSLIIHLALLFIGIKYAKKRPEILFGFLFYGITISIYTHLFRTLSDTMADRFLFFGSLGLSISLVGLLGLLFKINWKEIVKEKKPVTAKANRDSPMRSRALYYGIVGVAVIFSGLTISRNQVWKDDMTLVSHDLPYLDQCSRVHYYYASLLNRQLVDDKSLFHNPQKRTAVETEMVKHYQKSMDLSDYAYLSYLELGTFYCREFKYDMGIPILKKGITLFPEATDLSFYLGQTYVLTNQSALAVPLLEKSIKNAYNQVTNYYFLALAYGKIGKLQQALKVVEDGMKKFENEKLLFYDALGFIYFDNNDLDKSIEYTFKMVEYGKPEKDVYSYVIGRCVAKGDTEKGNHYREEAKSKGIVFQ